MQVLCCLEINRHFLYLTNSRIRLFLPLNYLKVTLSITRLCKYEDIFHSLFYLGPEEHHARIASVSLGLILLILIPTLLSVVCAAHYWIQEKIKREEMVGDKQQTER